MQSDQSEMQRARLALDAGRMGSWSWDMTKKSVVGDRSLATLFGLDFEDQPWPEDRMFASIHPDDFGAVQEAVAVAIEGADIYQMEFRRIVIDPVTGEKSHQWLGGRGNITERDVDGTPLRMIGVNWDATRQKTHEQRLQMLASEMDHRVKNAFGVMRALVNLGARETHDKASFASTLKTQVEALANAHAIAARAARDAADPNAPVPLYDAIHSVLSAWTGEPNPKARLVVDRGYTISPGKLGPLSMLISELVDNAAKHGALGQAEGALAVDASEGPDGDLIINWQETCAQTRETEPEGDTSEGFGMSLISHCISTLGGHIDRTQSDTGLHVALRIPKI